MKIKTDNKTRLLMSWNELTKKEQSDFDWFNPEEMKGDFVRYKGAIHCLDEFLLCGDELQALGWQGIEGQSAFHAVVMKYSEYDNDYVIMGSIFS